LSKGDSSHSHQETNGSAESHRSTKGSNELFEELLSESDLYTQREGLPDSYQMRHDEHYIEALIESGTVPTPRMVPVSEIDGSLPVDQEKLEGLVDSIHEFGVLQPLLVRRDRGRYEILSGVRRLAAAVAAGLQEVPCLVHDVDDVEARRLTEAANRSNKGPGLPRASIGRQIWSESASELVEQSLQTVLSTLPLLEQSGPELLRHRIAVGLIRAEALRTSRFLQGARILTSAPPVVRREVDLSETLRRTLDVTEEERGLLRIYLDLNVEEPCRVIVDPELSSLAVWGAVTTVLALLRDSRGASLRVSLTRSDFDGGATLTVSEDSVRMPTVSWARWLDLGWSERPGGIGAGVSLLAAKRAAELHQGRLDLSPTANGGCQISVQLPSS
jgi:hypothetical protein